MNILITIFLVYILFVIVTIMLAMRKHRNPALWGLAAAFGLLITLIGLAFFQDMNKLTMEEVVKSKKREQIFCGIVIALGAAKLLLHFLH